MSYERMGNQERRLRSEIGVLRPSALRKGPSGVESHPRRGRHLPIRVWSTACSGLYRVGEMRSLPRAFASTLSALLLLPALASGLSACAMPDCPLLECGVQATQTRHDCCPPAPAAVSMDCCEHAPKARVASPVLPERGSSATVVIVVGSAVAVAEPPVDVRFLPSRRQPRPPLGCLARTCALRN